MIEEEIKKIIIKIVGREIGKILVSERADFGNYSSNAPFLLAKERKQPPESVAKELAEKIKLADGGKLFSKVEAVAGYVNFFIAPSVLAEKVVHIATKKYPFKIKKQKINLEFVSANPTGPLTMANGRGGFLGDVLANVLELVGHKVVREYYINDAGNQIRLLGESILAESGNAPKKEEYYQGEYVKDLVKALKKEIQNKKDPEKIGRSAADLLLKEIQASLKNAGINFDVWYSEFKNLRGGKNLISKILAILGKNGLIMEKEGAKWLKSSEIADEKDRVLVKSDGQPTYFLVDMAYHYDKFVKRKFDKAIDIWGADHHGYVARLKSGVKAIGIEPDKLKIIITQLVRLIEGGKEIRMSKRKGEFITLDELIREVGVDSARYFFLMNTPDTHMDFDLALAKERSIKNPVYYVQYAYVRMRSILEKSKSQIKQIQISTLRKLQSESELSLLSELIKFPYMARQTSEDYQVNRLARYAAEIARAIHNFYEKERVIGEQKDIMEARLALIVATKIILEKLFKILGISAPEKM
ncbi:MAG: arginine--tRNA ligase [Patescibacteria group bacterium]